MIDTHTHLYFPEYGEEITGIIQRSLDSGVSHFILPNVNQESLQQIKDLHKAFPIVTSMAIGLHPTDVKEDWKEFTDLMETELNNFTFKAIGEIGMDLYWDQTYISQQKEAFEYQLKLAESRQLPVIIHSRKALEETLEVIDKIRPTVPLVFHSFTEGKESVKRIREICDPYFGINGVVTYKNAPDLREALPEIGLDRLLLETDAPFLSPVPHRGKRNDSSFLIHIRDKVAEVLGLNNEEIDKATDRNARIVFNL